MSSSCGYGWPDQFGRRWHRHRGPLGSLMSMALLFALIALAVSWWNGRRQPFTF